MKKEEAPMKKTEAKEDGAFKAIRVEYSGKKKTSTSNKPTSNPQNLKLYSFVALGVVVLLITCVFGFSYGLGDPRSPHFMLEDLYLDSATNSTSVKLSSYNPSSKSSIYYSKMHVWVWIIEDFETEAVYLASTLQQPREITRWTGPVATNNNNEKRPGGSFQNRNGVTSGQVIAKFSVHWKNAWIFSFMTRTVRISCPVSINLQELTSVVPRPMTRCSTSYL